ncbi:MAG: hypothetical protein ABWY06_17525 [Pseudomonas sp.]|uniref:hypothetical protein n=1 Tax=Pseudomonas sp. TaxID=306 RepID=UPI003390A42F
MGAAIYIVPERPLPGVDDFVNGKAIAKVDEIELEELCKSLKVTSIWAFVSQNADEFMEFLDADDETGDLLTEAWFEAEDGLKTVRALHGHLVTHPGSLANGSALIDDLQDYEWVLSALAEQDIKWHFAVDC